MLNTPKRQLSIILLIVLLGFIGNSIAYPIFAPLFLHPSQGHIVPDQWGAHWRSLGLGITLMMYPLGQFIAAPILGALSDQHGRKKVMLISTALMACGYILTALAITDHLFGLLILSRLLTGCCEGNISIARAMAIDIKALNRKKSLGLISAVAGMGYVIGPLLGGVLTDHRLVSWFNFSVPFYAAASFSMALCLVTIIGLHEAADTQSDRPSLSLMQQLNILSRLQRLCQNKQLKYLLIVSTLASLAIDTFYEFYPAYMTGLWHATPLQIAWYTMLLSIVMAMGCGWINHTLLHYFSAKRVILSALCLMILILLILLFEPPAWSVIGLFILIGLAISVTITSYTIQVSEAADTAIQGEVMGTLWGLRMLFDGITSVVGGGLILLAYSAPLVLAACAALLSSLGYYHWIAKRPLPLLKPPLDQE